PFPGLAATVPAAAAAALIAYGGRSRLGRLVLGNPAALFIGKISYPLYLWHWPLLAFARISGVGEPGPATKAALVATAFALSALTYFLVEKPVRIGPLRNARVAPA